MDRILHACMPKPRYFVLVYQSVSLPCGQPSPITTKSVQHFLRYPIVTEEQTNIQTNKQTEVLKNKITVGNPKG